ncbi:hypothetical protein MNBD_GAMMA24-870 [hydrothermal vent metagenome]|uniref:DUF2288 domain-containing protein n=1 Tax=hydrothermal vent metagenome TaxID=652676 RepID=A0A3B1BEE7_9ZZZZ
MNPEQPSNNKLKREQMHQKLNLESGEIDWSELQRHFARGVVIAVSPALDLVEAALKFVEDDRDTIENWLAMGQIKRADEEHAHRWNQNNALFWAIVVAPWVLVQEQSQATNKNVNSGGSAL